MNAAIDEIISYANDVGQSHVGGSGQGSRPLPKF
jgi:hypothetical protein